MKNTFLSVSFLVFLFLIFSFPAKGQDEKFKAIFIYNFTKYIEWPSKSTGGTFIICVLGSDAIIAELEGIAGKKMVGPMKIFVKKVNSPAEIGQCHIVYIPQSKSSQITQVVDKLKGQNVLIISDKQSGCSMGSGMNFINKSGKINFEVSKPNIEKEGLKVSSELLSLGISVN